MKEKSELKILVIDDNQEYLDVVEIAIARALPGAAVLAAISGAKGIELAQAEDPDVILLDITMPGMDGFEVCRRLKADKLLKNIPVVFMTAAQAGKGNRIKALEAGGEGFLPKPFETEELTAQIRAMAKIKAAGAAQAREAERLQTLVTERTNALEQELTERREAEEELQANKARLSSALEMAHLGHWEYDVASDLFTFTDHFYKIFRTTVEQVGGYTMHPTEYARRFIHPDDMGMVGEETRKAIETTDPHFSRQIEHRMLYADGSVGYIAVRFFIVKDPNGRTVKTYGVNQDITERKRAEEAISESYEISNALNAMLLDSLADTSLREKLGKHLAGLFALPWLAIQPKGAVLLLNSRGDALVLTAQQGLPPALLEACANVPLGLCLCGKAAETGLVVESTCLGEDHHITYTGIMPHGHYCVPVSAGGKTLGVLNLYLKEGVSLTDSQRRFVGSVTDIMAENVLHAQMEEKFVQAQKMESVGRLAGGVAHDFNNILTAIKCYSEFLNTGLDPQDPKKEDVREILTAADRAVGLTRQLLAFSRRQIMAPKVTDLNKCVGNVTNMLRRLIGEDITLLTNMAPAPCLAMLDTGQMEQVLVNLVINARDAMPKGGGIALATELLRGSEALSRAHPDLPRGPMVCLKVSDTGCGITPEIMKHLFEPFFTTKDQGKGTGLGLSTVFGIVKQSGGDIEVESKPGRGTLFSIYFPYCEAVPPTADDDKSAYDGHSLKGRETILFAEDEESLRRLGKRVLESSGYTVLTAASGAEALKVLEAHAKPVDLLVTDVIMPGMSGRELARELVRKGMVSRTLYMSGYTDDAIVKHGVLEPGLAFIYKPFTVDGMLVKVRTVLNAPADQAKA